jgi:hypothetical protein
VLRSRGCGLASLKRIPESADRQAMFAARQRPLLVLEDRLLTMRLSLNTPVLATAELPNGPARAAIFAYAEGTTRRFAVAVRALRGGSTVVYELQAESPPDADGWSVALDASLSFGESMGFLFDDEMIVDRNPGTLRRALARLRELITPGEVEDDDADASSLLGSSDDLAEILLEDELETRGAGPPASPGVTRPEPIAAAPEPPSPAIAPGVALSKFRTAKPAATPKAAPAARAASAAAATTSPGTTSRGGTTLGRVRPKRVRADGGEGGPVVDPLLRLLADF